MKKPEPPDNNNYAHFQSVYSGNTQEPTAEQRAQARLQEIAEQQQQREAQRRKVKRHKIMKRAWWVIAVLIPLGLIGGCTTWYFGTEDGQRTIKSWQSNNSGGLQRTIEVYDQGVLLKTYEGKVDIQDTEYGNKVLFDLDGRRITIYNATVITEERK